jgi:large subunit ribosomal protein L11
MLNKHVAFMYESVTAYMHIVSWKSVINSTTTHGPYLKNRRKSLVSKKIAKVLKLELPGGDAKPGPKLAAAGINMGKFTVDFNAKTADRRGEIVPVLITAYEDKSFDFVIKTSPVASLLLKAAGIQKGSSGGSKSVVGHISKEQLRKIAEYKLPDLNCVDIEAAMRIVEGSARNMGIVVDD